MGIYRISGVWKNGYNEITHYAFHSVNEKFTSRAAKKSKEEAIAILEKKGNTASTWIWNYTYSVWNVGEEVEVVNGRHGKYLRSNADTLITDHLAHLSDYDWIAPANFLPVFVALNTLNPLV